jgi:segregation and condensation protein B
MNEKNKVEAVLFSSGKRMTLQDISELAGITDFELIKQALNELKADYESRSGSVILVEEAGAWKLIVKDHYLPLVRKIISKTELDKPLIETLAVIAWKYPVVQADVIKIRHNKAYDHLKQLEEMGFVTRQKFGRTKKLTLTEKFFEYFDLPSEEAKQAFLKNIPEKVKQDLDAKEKEIDEGEKRIEQYNQKQEEIKQLEQEEKKKQEQEAKKPKEEKPKKITQDEIKDILTSLPKVQAEDEIPDPEPDSGKQA